MAIAHRTLIRSANRLRVFRYSCCSPAGLGQGFCPTGIVHHHNSTPFSVCHLSTPISGPQQLAVKRFFHNFSRNHLLTPPADGEMKYSNFFVSRRFRRRDKNNPSQKKAGKVDDSVDEEEDEDEEREESDSDDEADLTRLVFKEDSVFPDNYKQLVVNLKSARLDAVACAGFGMARNKMEEEFLSSKLRVNGNRAVKKSAQLHEGDYIDFVVKVDEEGTWVKRVRILRIDGQDERRKIYLRAWRQLTNIDE